MSTSEEPAPELVAERVPHDRIHADQPGCQMTNGKELDEFHVHKRGAGAQSQRITVAAHVGRGAVSPVKPGEATCRQNSRLGGQNDRRARAEMKRNRSSDFAIGKKELDDTQVSRLADAGVPVQDRPQGFRYGRAGVEKIHIDAARAVMARRHRLGNVAVFSRPTNAPVVHRPDAFRTVFAQQLRKRLVAEATSGGKRISVVMAPVIRRFGAEGDRHSHLCHYGGAAAANQAALGKQHTGAFACRLDRRVHAGGPGADHQDISFGAHGIWHGLFCSCCPRILKLTHGLGSRSIRRISAPPESARNREQSDVGCLPSFLFAKKSGSSGPGPPNRSCV